MYLFYFIDYFRIFSAHLLYIFLCFILKNVMFIINVYFPFFHRRYKPFFLTLEEIIY